MIGVKSVKWWIESVMGDHDYEHYCAHMSATHPDRVPLTEREYWRERYADADANPRSRCC